MTEKGFSLQDLIRSRQAGAFVGRTDSLRAFEQNLTLSPDDPRRRFVFTLSGDAGIGKTSLVRQWERVARGHGYATGYVDEAALDVPSAIELLARGLADGGATCPAFTEKLAQYRKHRHTVDSDPGAPSGISSLLTRSAVRIGLRATEDIPVVGAFAGEIDKDAVAQQADQARAFLARRFAKRQDIDLLLAPVDVLTTALVDDLRTIAVRRPIALFVDTFERTGPILDDWLLELLEGRHGSLPPNIVLAVSGQRPVDANRWSDYLGIRTDIELDVFTTDETRQLLAGRGVDDASTVELIVRLSGGLPVLVATLAESSATHGTAELTDQSDTAVDRFLKWEPDRERRDAARFGALPRRLDREVLSVAGCGPDDFDWLRRLPFVVGHTDGYHYHDVVRTPMLRSLRLEAPGDWTARHLALAEHYECRRANLGLSDQETWKDSRCQDLMLEEEYHRLCATGTTAMPGALSRLITYYGYSSDSAARWAQMITQAGQDSGADEVQARGDQLTVWLRSGVDGELKLLSSLGTDPMLDGAYRGTALAERSAVHERSGNYEAALLDLDKADALRPDVSWIIAWRGSACVELGKFEQALEDLDRAIELRPGYAYALCTRSLVHLRFKRLDSALEDINRCLATEPDVAFYLGSRGAVYQQLRRFPEARADFDRAVELASEDALHHAARASLSIDEERYAEALADLDQALAIDPDYVWALVARSHVLRRLKRYPEAIADVDHALTREPDDRGAMAARFLVNEAAKNFPAAFADISWLLDADPESAALLGRRANLLRLEGRFDEALADIDRAIALDPDDAWALGSRGRLHQAQQRPAEALVDLDRALGITPRAAWILATRGEVLRDLGRRQEAVEDLDLAIEIDPELTWAYAARGSAYFDDGDLDRAAADLDRAVALDPEYAWPLARRGGLRLLRGRYPEALTDLQRAVELSPNYTWAIRQRATAHERAGNLAAARLDHDLAVELRPDSLGIVRRRAVFLLRTGQHDEALRDLTRIVEAAPHDEKGWTTRGEFYQTIGDDAAALIDFGRAAAEAPADDWCAYRRALSHLRLGDTATAHELLTAAISSAGTPSEHPVKGQRDVLNQIVYLTALGDPEAARQRLETVLTAQPLADLLHEAVADLTDLATFIGRERVEPLLALL